VTSSSIKRRAVRDDQKLERRQELINQAWALFQMQPYELINIIDVARSAKLAKGTVYLYFKTKEELFLAVLIDHFAAWFDIVDAALPECPATNEAVVNVIASALNANPALVRLFAITHVILERNIDIEVARGFKQFLLERVTRTGALLADKLVFLEPEQGGALLMQMYALVIGVQHVADPAPIVREVLDTDPALTVFKVDFDREFRYLLTALLHGLATQNRSG
jgi:AcrR family transcriptional regulator